MLYFISNKMTTSLLFIIISKGIFELKYGVCLCVCVCMWIIHIDMSVLFGYHRSKLMLGGKYGIISRFPHSSSTIYLEFKSKCVVSNRKWLACCTLCLYSLFQVTAVEYLEIGLLQIVSSAAQEPKHQVRSPVSWVLLQCIFQET